MRQHDLTVELVGLEKIQQHPENANNGDLEAIEESIDVNGFYAPIIVQRSTGNILAGNHRFMVAHKQHELEIPVIYLDVTDEEAIRIMLADNRTTRKGFDDESQLFDLLDRIHDTDIGLLGTGYTNDDLTYLLNLADAPLEFPSEGVQMHESSLMAPTKSKKRLLNYSIDPQVDGEGSVYEVVIGRKDFKPLKKQDVNRIRKALGQEPLTDEEIDAIGASGW